MCSYLELFSLQLVGIGIPIDADRCTLYPARGGCEVLGVVEGGDQKKCVPAVRIVIGGLD